MDAASGERGAGKGAAALVPASAHSGPGARTALRLVAATPKITATAVWQHVCSGRDKVTLPVILITAGAWPQFKDFGRGTNHGF
jgi:hypothetical protein